ncbi:cobalamin biosynthesis protein CobW [Actinotalea ferrariae CF5-4]|uniref:Cobalamin biosynthesis protein CobW n=1 Tax=Actinotalea ferrariae CF5-4 TaxID=948458 RepID=A0A021VZU6_9CELL|nr:GTP-binding protein [Actinotalea ferrariae]EYR64597.1 cobalamin biosynthesis protein CobW [Actinotalea ferrariae CF5-4]
MPHRLPLTVLAGIEPVLRDLAVMHVLADVPDAVVVRHDITDGPTGDGELRRVVQDARGVLEDERLELEHACLSCAVREDALPVLRRLAEEGRWGAVVLALPVSGESLPVARTLAQHLRAGRDLARYRLAPVVATVDLDTVVEDVLGDDLLDERGLALTSADRRSVGEALAAQLAHADVVVATREGSTWPHAGSDLVDHLRARDGLRVDGLHGLDLPRLLTGRHETGQGEARLDPLLATAPHRTSPSGVWTLELTSPRPFHPERFVEHVGRLGCGRVRGRGVFWVANRPDSVVAWDGAGGQLSVGELGTWGRRTPFTRLVLTGTGDERPALREAFEEILLTDAEMHRGLGAWLDREDVLEPWLGARSVG